MVEPLKASLLGKAQSKGLVSYYPIQIRKFAIGKHKIVDDSPYGGGEGMLMRGDVLYSAWHSIISQNEVENTSARSLTVFLSPQGELFNQEIAKELSQYDQLILVCGHYEGVDQRFIDLCVDREISIGNYVLTGGELPALVLAEAITRLVPGVIGNENSIQQESLEKGLLKYPQYTRPQEFQNLRVPKILLSGNHEEIQKWRFEKMKDVTLMKRPDLWQQFLLKSLKDNAND